MGDPLGLIGAGGGAGRADALGPGVGPSRPHDPGAPAFKDVLLKNLEEVNRLQQDATQAVEDLQTGKRQDLEGVLIATQKADGSWDEEHFTAVGFPRVLYLRYHGYKQFFPLWALARYRNLKSGNSTTVLHGM